MLRLINRGFYRHIARRIVGDLFGEAVRSCIELKNSLPNQDQASCSVKHPVRGNNKTRFLHFTPYTYRSPLHAQPGVFRCNGNLLVMK